MKTVNYKGYQASVEFEDGTLFVKVLHISDLIIGECDKASEVEATARAIIDEYLETCAELGREPEAPFKGSFNVRMTPEHHRKAAMAAAEEKLSLNAWVSMAVTEKLDCDRLSDRFDGVLAEKQQEIVAQAFRRNVQSRAKEEYGYTRRPSHYGLRSEENFAVEVVRKAAVRVLHG